MLCDSCGHDMTDSDGYTMVGVSLNLRNELSTPFRERDRFIEMFGKDSINICFCCFAKTLGARPLNDSN